MTTLMMTPTTTMTVHLEVAAWVMLLHQQLLLLQLLVRTMPKLSYLPSTICGLI